MKGSRSITDSEYKQIKTVLSLRDNALFTLGCKTGFRISELLSLKVKDVFQFGTINSHVTVRKCNVKKKTEGRTIILNKEAIEVLYEWITKSNLSNDDFLFKSEKGGSIGRVQAWRILSGAYAECNLSGKLGTHCMRKSFAEKMYKALDKDLIATQKALGHKSINSTVSYLSFCEETINNAIMGI